MTKFQVKRDDEFVETSQHIALGESATEVSYKIVKHTPGNCEENGDAARRELDKALSNPVRQAMLPRPPVNRQREASNHSHAFW